MQRASDRWVSLSLSVLLHGALLAALVYGWILFRRPPNPAPTLAIEATVVDAKTVKGAQQAPPEPPAPTPADAAQETPAEPEGPPPPSSEQLAQREEERQRAEADAEEQRAPQPTTLRAAALWQYTTTPASLAWAERR